ncbi:Protein SODIUM POTASSIUM ROOT DEFECTIVE 1 [Camellia lanceoleosa]|uniref:Protein SODIUM POTASSIUM ROOT DEFECTIVE 1 n=1 Tax=Camellia lanceoleosa TaxID=1840588 RepID=A0ACC0IMU5_9ERIC|nr:Protein SODIUM POTASSIUM ROOT DEFECTIVE 1 [Camellia lanceoleosa]
MNMKMKMKTSVKMGRRGFMCQSPAATAVCMTGDPRSVILPRRPDHAPTLLNNTNNYTRLVESRRFGSADKRSSNALVPSVKTDRAIDRDRKALHKSPSVTSSSDQVFQVVVMRVSLHCQGCAGKVKKHISKMEGVTSFSIDLESKRVTVMGHVSPVGVLESISKVKRAEFWPC